MRGETLVEKVLMISERDECRIQIGEYILVQQPRIGGKKLIREVDKALQRIEIGKDAKGDLKTMRADGLIPTPPEGGGIVSWQVRSKVYEVTYDRHGNMARMEKLV